MEGRFVMGEAGPPRKEFDSKTVETFGYYNGTAAAMAARFECSVSTIEHRMADKDGEFYKSYSKGRDDLNKKLYQKQVDVALAGNVTMLIWLGKQHMGQMEPKDRLTIEEIEIIKKEISQLRDKMNASASKAA